MEEKLFKHDKFAFSILDEQGMFAWLNQAALEELGYTLEEMQEMHFTQVFKVDVANFLHNLKSQIKDNFWYGAVKLKRKDKTYYWKDVYTFFEFDPSQSFIVKTFCFFFDTVDLNTQPTTYDNEERAYYSLIDEGILIINEAGYVINASNNIQKYCGKPSSELIGINFFECLNISAEEQANYVKIIAEQQVDKLHFVEDISFNKENVVLANIDLYPIQSKQTIIGYKAIVIPANEYHANRFVNSNESDFYKNIIDNVRADISIINNEQKVIFANSASINNQRDERFWILPSDLDNDTLTLKEKHNNLVKRRSEYFFTAVMGNKEIEWEECYYDGKEHVYTLRIIKPVYDKNGSFIFSIVYGLDISKRVKSQQRANLVNKLLENISNYAPINSFIINQNKELEFYNGKIINAIVANIKPKSDKKITLAEFYKICKIALPEGNYFFSNGQISLELDFDEIIVEYYINYDPISRKYFGTFIDLTQEVRTKYSLETALGKAKDAMEFKNKFLANISHEIRTPLNGVIGMLNLLGKTQLSDIQANYLKILKNSSDNLLLLVNNILDLEKIKSGKLEFHNTPFNFVQLIEQCFSLMEGKAKEKGLYLEYKLCPACSFEISGDVLRINQILLNLISNGIKFTQKGKVTVEVDAVTELNNQMTYMINVSDTGIGISESKIEHIFDEFIQENKDTYAKFGGTGLGLSISKNIIEMMGGRIWVESDGKSGASFKLLLSFPILDRVLSAPIEKVLHPNAENPPHIEHPLTQQETAINPLFVNKKVLVAEDSEVNITYIEALLSMVGCTISIAKNGVEAVEKTQNQSFDLVLMDVNMPIMDGIQATQILRRSKKPEIANLPIIACTANAIKGDSERFLSEGFSDYMSKPFKEEDLMKLLDKYLNTTSKQTLPKDFAHSDSKMYELKLPAMSNGSSELQSRLNAVFVETMPENIERIQLAVENKDIEDLKDVAHKMKSNIDLFNITSIRDDIRFLESDAIENETWHDIQNYVKKITFTLENVILALKK